MFRKILIANRGENRRAHHPRLPANSASSPVAIFSEGGSQFASRSLADEAYPIGPLPRAKAICAR